MVPRATSRTSRIAGPLTLLVGIGASALAFWWLRRPPAPPEPPPPRPPMTLPVKTALVERGTLTPEIPISGRVRAPERVRLGFDASGPLADVPVVEGQRVAAGELLAAIDPTDRELGVIEARAGLALAQRELELLEAGEREEVIAQLKADVAVAEADLRLAELEVERQGSLVEKNASSQAVLDAAVAQRDASRGRLSAARERLTEAERGSRPEDLEIARAKVTQAEASLRLAERELEKTELVAPFDGLVARRMLVAGDHASVGAGIVELLPEASLELELEIPGKHLAHLGDQPSVLVELPDGGRTEFVLDTLVPEVDALSQNARGLVRVHAEHAARRQLRPGLAIRALLRPRPIEDALIVPRDALRRVEDGLVVVRVEPIPGAEPPSGPPQGPPAPRVQAAFASVRVLGEEGGRAAVEVLDGALSAGERVVVVGLDRAAPGGALLPRDEPPPGAGPAGEGETDPASG